ncbi:MAG: hypothetical protein K2O18_00195 [Oscillospiraceae bacterium]|nr:hypothetical protein [Oscillospiraceae bacterium]
MFLSISDGTSRADVCHGTGRSLKSAWDAALKETEAFLQENPKNIIWVKADAVSSSEVISRAGLSEKLLASNPQQFLQGLSFDSAFETALIDSELNGTIIYDYRNGAANKPNLDSYLASAGRKPLETYPENFIAFQCRSWFCDENNEIYELKTDSETLGRREIKDLDAACTREIIAAASGYLARQVREDGSFTYIYYPRFSETPEDYNNVRHAGTVWSMVQAYGIAKDEALAGSIKKAIEYMLTKVVYDEEGRAFLYNDTGGEISLGGGALAALALTEYTEVFQDGEYLELCMALGEGMLSLQDHSSGVFYHILSRDFKLLDAYRTVYFDGEATLALCRLYGLTKDERFLSAAQLSAGHFIAADYTQYHDHWVAYSMNELTKYVTDSPEYWTFAMDNITNNLDYMNGLDKTAPAAFEMLMAAFETYSRAPDPSILSANEQKAFLEAVRVRSQWMLNGYFYPEYAMYMENPQQILGTFMTRTDGYRVRIDDVQHNIGGAYLYQKNYDRLKERGMLSAV